MRKYNFPFIIFTCLLLALLACQKTDSVIFFNDMNSDTNNTDSTEKEFITLFLCGDVMTGRGIDQILPKPSNPVIHEPYMKSAKGYVELAEAKSGSIKKPVNFSYIWGDAVKFFERIKPDLKIINLETSVTKSDEYWKDKGINYRMSPDNIDVLTAVEIDYASLSNNHVLDWGHSGLKETIEILNKAGIKNSGAGMNLSAARRPAVIELENNVGVIVISVGSTDSGIPFNWEATKDRPGLYLIKNFSDIEVDLIKGQIEKIKNPEDIVVVSIHWGSNWGYYIPNEHRKFAHKLIDEAGVDVIHGHSSHHLKGIEVYKGKPVIYGAGDFITDYEGISGFEFFRDDLTLMYFVSMDIKNSQLKQLKMVPMQIKRFRLNRVSVEDSIWLEKTLKRESKKLGTNVSKDNDGIFYIKR